MVATGCAAVVDGFVAGPPACSPETVLWGVVGGTMAGGTMAGGTMVGELVAATGGAVGETTIGPVVATVPVGRSLVSERSGRVALDGALAIDDDDEVGSVGETSPASRD